MGQQQLGGGQHFGLELGTGLDPARTGEVQDRRARAHAGQCQRGRFRQRRRHRLAAVERALQAEEPVGKIRRVVEKLRHHPVLPAEQCNLQALDLRGMVEPAGLGCELQPRPAVEAVLQRHHLQEVGALQPGERGARGMGAQPLQSPGGAGVEAAVQALGIEAQGIEG
ncbi:hypothetical protein [Salipiger thiooxidans]|uniref:hypothetical protein n=1 Tax=Salipiger thiooxidans TaxID=282683 RepID=UPI001CD70092|nr:hypothetical protein [Salipiger thiooxidans]MCA0846024.1 hypothetical protein [Salipiger thiooxidans]